MAGEFSPAIQNGDCTGGGSQLRLKTDLSGWVGEGNLAHSAGKMELPSG